MLVDSNGNPVVSGQAPIQVSGTPVVPGYPLASSWTFDEDNFDRLWLAQSTTVPGSFTWHTDDPESPMGYARFTNYPFTGTDPSGRLQLQQLTNGQTRDIFSAIFEFRVDDEYAKGASWVANGGGSGTTPKLINQYGDKSCGGNEITVQNISRFEDWASGITAYTNCGARRIQIFKRDANQTAYRNYQMRGECGMWYRNQVHPDDRPALPKYQYQPGIWMTYLSRISGIGTPETWYDVWCYAYGGDPQWADRWVHVISFLFQGDWPADKWWLTPQEFYRIQITQYTTGKDPAIDHVPQLLEVRKGVMCGPYDFTPFIAQGPWQGPNMPNQDHRVPPP